MRAIVGAGKAVKLKWVWTDFGTLGGSVQRSTKSDPTSLTTDSVRPSARTAITIIIGQTEGSHERVDRSPDTLVLCGNSHAKSPFGARSCHPFAPVRSALHVMKGPVSGPGIRSAQHVRVICHPAPSHSLEVAECVAEKRGWRSCHHNPGVDDSAGNTRLAMGGQ